MSTHAVARLRGVLFGALVFVTALAAWEAWARSAETFYFPPVSEIGREALDLWRSADFLRAVGASLRRLAAGYAIGAAAGIAIGLAMGSSHRVRRTLGPTTEFLRALPVIAAVPIAIVLLGDGDAMRIAVIAFGVFFPVLVGTVAGVLRVPPEIRDAAALLHLGTAGRTARVFLPAALPAIFAGLRTALPIGLVLVVISEFTGTGDGLGVYIWTQRFVFDVHGMYAGILFLGLIGFVLNGLFVALERRVLAWHYGAIGEPVR